MQRWLLAVCAEWDTCSEAKVTRKIVCLDEDGTGLLTKRADAGEAGRSLDIEAFHARPFLEHHLVTDPTQVVTEAVETFQAQPSAGRISLVTEIVPPPFVLAFDPARMLQVLTNLLSNAIKFTPAGGTVVIRVERLDGEARFAVSDTGPGVPADLLDAVFECFLQGTKNDQRGVGLGLYISRAIVEGHGGRIWAENRVGGGTTFCFTLPAQS